MTEYKYNFGDEVIITYGKLNGIHSTIIYREKEIYLNNKSIIKKEIK